MRVNSILWEDFTNYKKPAMLIGTISCGGKCCLEAGIPLSVCHNDALRNTITVTILDRKICKEYIRNPITEAVVFGGLEPFEQMDEMYRLIYTLRFVYNCGDDVVIYTGYNKEEIPEFIKRLQEFDNIIVKFGRYVPNRPSVYDELLGVKLVSDNQYAEKIS